MKQILFLVFVLLYPFLSYGQNHPDSSGPRTSYCYRISQAPLTSVPPLHTDMDLTTLVSYIYWDSIMRSTVPDSIITGFNSITSLDSVKPLMKMLYSVSNYDAALFAEYWNTGKEINPLYWGPPGTVWAAIRKKICQTIGFSNPTNLLINAGYALHIKVTNVVSDSDISARPWMRHHVAMPIECIEAQILDTLKGQHILNGDCSTGYDYTSQPCVHFFYGPGWSKDVFDCSSFDIIYGKNSYGDSVFHVGSEYIVFLQANYLDYNGQEVFFDVQPITTYDNAGGVYPIIDGVVHDDSNFFTVGTRPSVSDFESQVRTVITGILH